MADSNNGGLTSASAYWDNGDIKALRRAVWNDPTSKMHSEATSMHHFEPILADCSAGVSCRATTSSP